MNFYTPNQKKPIGVSAGPINAGPISGDPAANALPPSRVPGTGIRPGQWGDINLQGGLLDPGWNTDQSFQKRGQLESLKALQGAASSANPADYAAMDKMRAYYSNALDDLPGLSADRNSTFDTQAQVGLRNMLSQYKNANAGRGTLGSRQYAGGQGDIVSRANSDYINGLINARSDALNQAGKINEGFKGIQGQDLAERAFQNAQAQSYADLIAKYVAGDQARESGLMQRDTAQDAANKAMWGQIIGSALGGAGAIAGGGAK